MSLPKMNSQRLARCWTLISATILLMCAEQVTAGTGVLIVMPLLKTRPTSGLQLVVDTFWVESSGYRPVRATFRPIRKRFFPADRQLIVELRPGRGSPLDTRLEVSRPIELPEGAESASITLYLPQSETYGSYGIRVYEDGRILRDLSDRSGTLVGGMAMWSDDSMPVTALLTFDVPSVYQRRTTSGRRSFSQPEELSSVESIAHFTRLVSSRNPYNSTTVPLESWMTYSPSQISGATVNFEYLHPADLPPLLPGLSAFDLILIQRDDLMRMADETPNSLDVLRRWLLAGGNLCTTGGGDNFADRAEIESLLGIQRAEIAPRRAKRGESIGREWRFPDDWEYGSLIVEFRNAQRRWVSNPESTIGDPPKKPPFVIRPAQFGQLILTRDEVFDLGRNDWNWVFKSIPNRLWKWEWRQGLSMKASNEGFWDFLIPGVGLPPVNAFRVLITLFVLSSVR
jgi:hypothetical protein